MANELTNTITATYSKNSSSIICGPITAQISVSGNNALKLTRSIAISDVTLSIGSVSTVGWVYLHNLDATNYITFGSDGSAYPLKLKAGESCLVRWNAAAIHALANTAACLLEYAVFED